MVNIDEPDESRVLRDENERLKKEIARVIEKIKELEDMLIRECNVTECEVFEKFYGEYNRFIWDHGHLSDDELHRNTLELLKKEGRVPIDTQWARVIVEEEVEPVGEYDGSEYGSDYDNNW